MGDALRSVSWPHEACSLLDGAESPCTAWWARRRGAFPSSSHKEFHFKTCHRHEALETRLSVGLPEKKRFKRKGLSASEELGSSRSSTKRTRTFAHLSIFTSLCLSILNFLPLCFNTLFVKMPSQAQGSSSRGGQRKKHGKDENDVYIGGDGPAARETEYLYQWVCVSTLSVSSVKI